MRVLIWATTFGGDLWSFTRYLDQRSDVEVKVVMGDPRGYSQEPVASLFPLQGELIKRGLTNDLLGPPSFRPHVTVLDNRVPLRATSKAGLVLWHGFGWKGPNDRKEFRFLHADLKRAWGDPLSPNPNFRWQCFGPFDFEHRTKISGFHPTNCRLIGAASHDDLRMPLDRKILDRYYEFDVAGRKTVLLAPTWHYGEVFAHWGRDADLFEQLIQRLADRQANLILRLHDSFRFPRKYVQWLRGLARTHKHVLVKFKDECPDNYLDLQVADVLLTNYSSIANLFYATGRPTIHIYPVRHADEAFMWRQQTLLGTRTKKIDRAKYIWKLPPEDNGGLLAKSFRELLNHLDQALDDPRCCETQAQDFLDRHMMGGDGRACERAFGVLQELVDQN
jgi:hypothetical protein